MLKQFSYSQAMLAIAIAFFAFSLFKFTLQVPQILEVLTKTAHTVDSVVPKVDDIIEEVEQVRGEIGNIRDLFENNTLPIVEKVVLESEHYSRNIPALLTQLSLIEQQVSQLQSSLPSIIERVDNVVQATNNTTSELALWRPHSLRYLDEISLSREYIPGYLLRAENIVSDAKTIGSEASSGIVSGFFKGVVRLPFKVVSGLTDIVRPNSLSAENLTTEDVTIIQGKSVELLSDSNLFDARWKNVNSGNRGTITKGEAEATNGITCVKLVFNNFFGRDKETLEELMCQDDKGLWSVK